MKFLTSLRTMLSMLLLLPLMAVAQIESGKVYMFMNEGNAGKAMAPGSGSSVTIATANESNVSHRWYVEEAGSSFRVRSLGTGLYLRNSGVKSQNWTLVATPDANCTLDVKAVGDAFTLCAKGNTNDYGFMHYGAGTGTIVCWSIDTPATLWKATEVAMTADEIEQNWKELEEVNFTTEQYNAWKAALAVLFKDKACTQLADAYATYTKAQMEADANYQVLPKDLKNMVLKMTVDGTWDEANVDATKPQWDAEYAKRLRVQLVEPYCSKEEAAAVLHMNAHTNYNNPLGIYANGRQTLYIMVEGSIEPGATLYLATWTGHSKPGGKTDGYRLVQGLNVIPNFADGMTGCINYVVNAFNASKRGNEGRQLSLEAFKDIKVHIEGGNLNGYFNLMGDELWGEGDDNADWDYYAARATHTAMPMLGQYMTLHFPFFDEDCVSMDKEGNVESIERGLNSLFTGKNIAKQSLIEWDNIMLWERLVMGLASKEEVARANATWKSPYSGKDEVISHTGDLTDGYASDYENYYRIHGLAFGVPTGYMYGSWDHSGYNYNTMKPILVDILTDSGSHWGPGHEIGHQHQEPFTLNGLMEVTNNLFSNVALWYFGKSTSRVNGTEGMLEVVAKSFNQPDGDFYTNNIWALTHMYFRLFLYYHVLGNNTAFYPRLYEMMRQHHMVRVNQAGGIQTGKYGLLHFYKMACQAAGEDLTEFFRAHGVLTVMDERFVGDYSNSIYTSTQEEIDEAIAWVKKNGWKESLAPLFINDGTGQEAVGPTGHVLEHFDTDRGQKLITAHVGHYAYFDVPATDYTYELGTGGVINLTGEGGVGFLIRNDKGEILAFSNKKQMYVTDEVSMKLVTGEVKVEAINGDNTFVEVTGDAVAGMRTLLKDIIDRANEVRKTQDTKYTQVGFYRKAYLEELDALCDAAEEVYNNQKVEDYASVYTSLYAALENVMNNADAVVKFLDGVYYQLGGYSKNKVIQVNTSDKGLTGESKSSTKQNQQWIFESAGEADLYYIKNRTAKKYISEVVRSQKVLVGDTPVAFKLINKGVGVFALECQEGDKLSLHIDAGNTIVGWDNNNENSWWKITAVSISAEKGAQIALNDLINRTRKTLLEMGKSVVLPGQIPLQVTNSAAKYYLSSNADQNSLGNTTIGDGLAGLIDGNTSTFFQSYCQGSNPNLLTSSHNLTVDLGNGLGLQQFTFNFATRKASSNAATSPAPERIKISGSNNSLDYEPIVTLKTDDVDFPTYVQHGKYWYSDTITADTTYRYIRFEVTRSAGPNNSNYGGKPFFAMSEFGMECPVVIVNELQPQYKNLVEIYTETAEEMFSAQKVLNNPESGTDVLNATTAALQEQYDALLAARKDPSAITGVELDALGKGAIYDVSGRRVNNITAPGLYIINGQKRLVK